MLDLVVRWGVVPGCPFGLTAPVLNIKYSSVGFEKAQDQNTVDQSLSDL